jgi:TRAP-type C4-dicarboxylate transport system permease small subunit
MRSRRRRSADAEVDNHEEMPTLLEIVIESVLDPVMKSTVGRLKSGVRTAVDWTVQRLIAGGVVAGILIAGILLVLAAGVKGLEALHCPVWLCYLSMGVVAVVAALLLLKQILSTEPEDDLTQR